MLNCVLAIYLKDGQKGYANATFVKEDDEYIHIETNVRFDPLNISKLSVGFMLKGSMVFLNVPTDCLISNDTGYLCDFKKVIDSHPEHSYLWVYNTISSAPKLLLRPKKEVRHV